MSVTNFSQPYKLINDEKLKIKSSKVERVLDGELDILYRDNERSELISMMND